MYKVEIEEEFNSTNTLRKENNLEVSINELLLHIFYVFPEFYENNVRVFSRNAT